MQRVIFCVVALLVAFVVAQKATYPPKTCTTAFTSGSTILGCQHCDSNLAFYYWDGTNYVRRDDPNIILDPNTPSVAFTQQSLSDIERLGYGQCVYADVGNQDSPTYTLPTLNCGAYGLTSDCYYSFGLLKSASFNWDYGFGQSSCPWWNITSGGTLRTSELCDGVATRQGISHIFYCVDAPKKCHLETCMCAEWQMTSFELVPPCGAKVTWRVWNYCANSPYWIKFNVAGLGTVTVNSISYPNPNYKFTSSVIDSDSDFGGVKTLAFTQQSPFNTNFGFAGSPDSNYIDVTFTVSSWPGADYDWYMGMHAGTYWDYYNTKDYYRDGDWSTACQKSATTTCTSENTCGSVYCCNTLSTTGGATKFSGSSCPTGYAPIGVAQTNKCVYDCNCVKSSCETTPPVTTAVGDTTPAQTTSKAPPTKAPTTTPAATTTGPPTTTPVPTTTKPGDTPPLTTATEPPTSPPVTTKPPLDCEVEGTCVTLPPVTQNPDIPNDCCGHAEWYDGATKICSCENVWGSDLGLDDSVDYVEFTGEFCCETIIHYKEKVCSAYPTCELCNAGTAGPADGSNPQQCEWRNCGGATQCVLASEALGDCSAVDSCAGTVVFQPGQCPDNCSKAGVCQANGTCVCKKGVTGINCGSRTGLSAAAKAAAISGGVIAAIVIAGVIGIVIISFGTKKAVDHILLNEQAAAKSHISPLYQDTPGSGESAIYGKN
jgi:hypothetical protein